MIKRIVSVILAAVMMCSALCVYVAAEVKKDPSENGESEILVWNDICSKTKDGVHVNPETYSHDEEYHWLVCSECGEKNAVAKHDYDESGKCKVCLYESFVPGDVDGKAGVDADDAIYLLYHVFFSEDYPISQPTDFDGDGDTDADDAIYLLYYVFFPDDYPLGGKKPA